MIKAIITIMLSLQLSAYTLSDDLWYAEAVANKEASPTITIEELHYMYTGKLTHWADGSAVHIVVDDLKSYEQKSVIITMLGISISRFKEIIASNDNISIMSRGNIVSALQARRGSLGIISSNKLLLCTDAGLVVVRIVE